MFDNLNIVKAYKITDNVTGNDVEIATFNAVLIKDSNINVYMNINYPKLYSVHKDDILIAYREFNADVSALACTMELANKTNSPSTLELFDDVREDFKVKAKAVFDEVIASLGEIQVNPIPQMDINMDRYMDRYR